MKKILKSLGLLAIVAAMIYSSLSLMPNVVSADGDACCANNVDCGPWTTCQVGGSNCNDANHPGWNKYCRKKCPAEMECDEGGGGS